ncbi:hypothetical protein [Isoptericola aurantiacus]|uniref:hypothetical protein n=1 Tax=Isoptericola aurantiacus TaxID=3377839 RepID=UPI003839E081
MAGITLIVLGGLLVAVPAAVAVALLRWSGRHAPDGAPLRRARRHDALIAWASTVAGLVTAAGVLTLPITWTTDRLPAPPAAGVLWTVGPFAVAVAACLVRAVGELTWPRPAGTVRTASLTRRTVRDLGSVPLRALGATAALLATALVAAGVTAGPSGTSVASPERTLADGSIVSGSAGPYPGWPYGVPMLAALAVTLVVTIATLRVVARRAPLTDLSSEQDDAVRRTSAARTVAAVQVCVGGATALTLVVTGGALRRAGTARIGDVVDRVAAMTVTGYLATALAVAIAAVTVAVVVRAARGVPVAPVRVGARADG